MRCAILGSGNIGTDLMMKLLKGTDASGSARRRWSWWRWWASTRRRTAWRGRRSWGSRGRMRARSGSWTTPTTSTWSSTRPVRTCTCGTTSSTREAGIVAVDLTPAARGPKVIAAVNLTEHLDAPNINMVTCGGQATTPMVYAVRRAVESLPYAEMVSTVSSKSAGPGTRQNIDEFTKTTSTALREIGGAELSKAIIILNPAEPPIMMRNTVFAGLPEGTDHDAVLAIGLRDGDRRAGVRARATG